MKIKLQTGGVITYTPFIPNNGPSASTASTKSSESKDKITGTMQAEIIKVLNESGLQSDVESFLSEANSFLTKSSQLSTMSLFGGNNDDYTMSHLIGVLSLANKVKRNKQQWDAATAKQKDENSWHEVATSSDGGIYVYTNEGLKSIDPSEYYKNKDKYKGKALTNSQLLGLREQDSALAFNFNILSDLSGTIGMKTISDTLVDIIDKFGNNTLQGYIQKTGDQVSQSIWNGMQSLIKNGPDGYYKAKSKSEKDDMTNAIKYLWRSLGSDGQKRLRAETAISGEDPDKDYLNLILEAFNFHTDYEQSADFDKSATDFDPDGDGEGDLNPQWEDDTYLSVIAKGKGIRKKLTLTPSTTSPIENQIGLTTTVVNQGRVVDENMNPVPQTSLPDMLNRGVAFKARPDTNVTFGNKVLTKEEIKTIVTDEEPFVEVVELPYKETVNGIVPDFSMLNHYEAVNKALTNKPDMDQIELNLLLAKHGIDPSKVYIDSEGNWHLKIRNFIRTAGYISEDLVELSKDNKRFMDKVDNSEGNQKRKLFNTILKYQKSNPDKNDPKVHSTFNFWGGGGDWDRGDMYRGYIYTTAPDEWLAALLTGQNKINKHLLSDIDKRILISRNQQDSPFISQLQ